MDGVHGDKEQTLNEREEESDGSVHKVIEWEDSGSDFGVYGQGFLIGITAGNESSFVGIEA